jgi:uncharacterized protein Ymh
LLELARSTCRSKQSCFLDFRGYASYFYKNELKEAVGAAFGRHENKLNEVRDSRGSALAKKDEGKTLVYALFRKRCWCGPIPKDALEQGLTSIISGALGWIRNPYTHEKHNLSELTPGETLELLSVASYLTRMLEQSIP